MHTNGYEVLRLILAGDVSISSATLDPPAAYMFTSGFQIRTYRVRMMNDDVYMSPVTLGLPAAYMYTRGFELRIRIMTVDVHTVYMWLWSI